MYLTKGYNKVSTHRYGTFDMCIVAFVGHTLSCVLHLHVIFQHLLGLALVAINHSTMYVQCTSGYDLFKVYEVCETVTYFVVDVCRDVK